MRTLMITALAAVLTTGAVASSATAETSCTPTTTILSSPFGGGGSVLEGGEVQARAVNDRGDVVGFAFNPQVGGYRAILWQHGNPGDARDLGVLPGYVSSEAYGVNRDRVVIGVLYDANGRSFPFRWEDGRMTVLKGPDGRRHPGEGIFSRNSINERGQIAGTLLIDGARQAVRWSATGRAALLGPLPGHAWSDAFGINDDGLVSGWSRKKPVDGAPEDPVVWPEPGRVVPMRTAHNRTDGIAEQTNSTGLTVGYLGTARGDEVNEAVVWRSRTARPQLVMGLTPADTYGELVDVNDRGQAAGMSGVFAESGLPLAKPAVWQVGHGSLSALPVPAPDTYPVVTTELLDINRRGVIVGNVYRLEAPDFPALRQIDPVVWTCSFGD